MGGHPHHAPPPSATEVTLPKRHPLARLVWPAAIAGVVLVAAVAFLAGGDPQRVWGGYLVAYLYFLTLSLGGLFFVLALHACRAGWGVVVRRLAEHLAATLPVFALLFVPLAFAAPHLFSWFSPEARQADHLLSLKAPYLDPGFFWARAAVYLVAWSLLGWWFRRASLAQDASGEPRATRRMQTVAAPAIVVYALTFTFAAFDWVMSLDPHWYSTIFGVYLFAGAAVGVCAVLSLAAMWLERPAGGARGPLAGLVTIEHYHDLGKLLLAFVVFWAYVAFSQFMLIWYGNIPEETLWFFHRWEHGWKPVSIALAVGHFGLPFFVLLLRVVKRRRPLLAAISVWMLVVHYLDLYWLIVPALSPESPAPRLADLVAFAGVGAVWLAAWGWLLAGRAAVPVADPRLAESLSFENA
ncbi:MAG TPA: hypothetical protein VHM02_10795 [Thermoanaerobaculia bacterium]|nr:hypothetical protein [Thermoanaerobaculia bacterium]